MLDSNTWNQFCCEQTNKLAFRDVMAEVLDYRLEESEFEFHSLYFVYLWTNTFAKGK